MSRLLVNKILFSCILVGMLQSFSAQSTDVMIELGINAFKQGEYMKANQLFENAIKVDSNKLNLQYYYGVNLIKIHHYKRASKFLKMVVEKDPSGKSYPEASYYFGEMLKQNGNYNDAILEFKKAKAHFIHDKENFYYIKSSREINSTIFALRHRDQINKNIVINPLAQPVNGYNADFAGFENNGKLYFSSVKDSVHAQIYFQNKNKEVQLLNEIIDNSSYHNANGIFHKNQQYFIFTRCDSISHCKIMLSKKEKDTWNEPKELSNELNINSHNITQPFLCRINGSNILFFCSDKKGGYGKLDIWYAEILDDFSVANIRNAGAKVNSIENDITPFYHEPSNRLYFSSTWHNGYGGYDVFYSHWNDSIFESPINAEQPINSAYNDMYFCINEEAKKGYLSSNRDGSLYSTYPNCCSDIWKLNSKTSIAEQEDVTANLNPSQIFKHKTGLTLPLALYFHNDEPMPNSLATIVEETYPESLAKYIALQPTYIKLFCNGSSLEERKAETEQINYFFDKYIKDGLAILKKFVAQLIPLLDEHKTIEVTIKGFASPLAKDDYNTNLSKRRISSLINYFNAVDSGALKPFIETGRLILKSAPFGENKSNISASDNEEDTKKSIYCPKAAIERRIEIQEVIFKD